MISVDTKVEETLTCHDKQKRIYLLRQAPSNLVLSFQSHICRLHRTRLHALRFACLCSLFDTVIASTKDDLTHD